MQLINNPDNFRGMKRDMNISRRDLIQNMVLATAGLGLAQFATGKEIEHEPTNPLLPFYLQPQAPLQPGPAGIDIRTWVKSSKTNMQFSCVETAVAPKTMGPAPHLHKALDEIMLVLDGTATVIIDGKVEEIQAGGWNLRPRNIEHTFWNGSEKPLRFMDMYFNQNFEDFLEELFHKIIPDMMKNNLTPKDPQIAQRLTNLENRYGVTMFPEKRQALVDKYGLKG